MGSMTDGAGLIATLVRGHEVLVKHFDVEPLRYLGRIAISDSTANFALADLIAFCDAGGWRVRTISTPNTILRDMKGARTHRNRADKEQEAASPEHMALTLRPDLVEEAARRQVTTAAANVRDDHHRIRA